MSFKIKIASATSNEVKFLSAELHGELELMYGEGTIEDFEEENKRMLAFYVAYNELGNAVA